MAAQTKLTALHFRQIHERTDDDADKYDLGIENMVAYNDWVDHHDGLPDPVWDEAEWVEQVLSTNYHDPESLDALLRLQQSAKGVHVVIGEYNGIGYRIIIDRAILKATVPVACEFASLMPPELLGFVRNISVGTPKVGELRTNVPVSLTSTPADVEAGDPRKDSVVESKLHSSTVTIGNDDTGFVFFQLGGLEAAPPSEWSRRKHGVSEDDITWSKSPHVLVIKIRDSGRGSSAYIMPTTHTRTEPFNDELHMGVRISNTFSGIGSPQWFLSSRDTQDNINPLFEYVSVVLNHRGAGPRVVREYIPQYSEEEEDEPMTGEDESTGNSGRDADDEESILMKELFEG